MLFNFFNSINIYVLFIELVIGYIFPNNIFLQKFTKNSTVHRLCSLLKLIRNHRSPKNLFLKVS